MLKVVPDAPTQLRPADSIIASLRKLADDIEAADPDDRPIYLSLIISNGDPDKFQGLRHFGMEPRDGAAAEQCAFDLLFAQRSLMDMMQRE